MFVLLCVCILDAVKEINLIYSTRAMSMKKKDIIEWSRDDVDVVFYEKGGKKIVVISSGIWDDDERVYTIARV